MDNHHDSLICKIFLKKNGIPNGKRTEKINKYPNIKEYLDNRYNDSQSYTETIGRIKYNCEIRPVCKVCGNPVEYLGIYKGLYLKWRSFCCLNCEGKGTWETHKETNKRKYGVELTQNLDKVKNKQKKTCIRKYGIDVPMKSKEIQDKCKLIWLNNYGVDHPMKSNVIQEKIKKYFIHKYGVPYSWLIPDVQQKIKITLLEKYGIDNVLKLPKFHNKITMQKRYNTMKLNGTFNTSKPEEELYLYIKEKFPSVERQYNKDNRYPWRCDFYIQELDCFIEYNGFQSHGPHAYNKNSKDDQLLVEKWKLKYDNGNHPLYKRMIEGWTISDVKKRETAKNNKLNFHEFWNLEDAKQFINSL